MSMPLSHPQTGDLELPKVLNALADPLRLAFLVRMDELGEVSCGSLGIDLPKSTASHHFRVLREAGITRVRQEGTLRFTSLRREDLERRFPMLLDSVLRAARTPR